MVTVPIATPVTTPVLLTVAMAVLLLLHVPPVTESESGPVEPVQIAVGPVIVPAVAPGFMVITRVAAIVPQPVVTE